MKLTSKIKIQRQFSSDALPTMLTRSMSFKTAVLFLKKL